MSDNLDGKVMWDRIDEQNESAIDLLSGSGVLLVIIVCRLNAFIALHWWRVVETK